jgi:flagellar hook-associated protein 2
MATDGTAGAAANTLGIAAGGSTDGMTKTLTGGTTSATSGATAIDATFSLNGIELTRTTNVVKDAADGVSFTLKQGGQTGLTTLTVGPDKVAVSAAVQDFITKFNTLLGDYKTASTSTKNADGSINQAPLANDANTRALMANLKAKLVGASPGMASNATYKTLASLGVTTQTDGTLYLNANTLQNALVNDISSAQNLFLFSGTSTNQVVTLKSGGPQTATGPVSFTITKDGTGALSGTLTQNNVTSDPIAVSNGTLVGTGSYAGLVLNVTGAGTGTLNLTRGAGQAAADLLSSFTSTAAGSISSMLTSITNQNNNLSKQIAVGQAMLDQEKKNLTKKFADMEAAVGQMKAAAGSLSGA